MSSALIFDLSPLIWRGEGELLTTAVFPLTKLSVMVTGIMRFSSAFLHGSNRSPGGHLHSQPGPVFFSLHANSCSLGGRLGALVCP